MREEKYILTDVINNNNKWFTITLGDDGRVVSTWGRVGDSGQRKDYGCKGEGFFLSKCREKEKKGYTKLQVVGGSVEPKAVAKEKLADVAKKQLTFTNPVVEELIGWLAQANIHSILTNTSLQYDAAKGTFSTALGVITQEAIDEARKLLGDMGSFVEKSDWYAPDMAKLVSQYLRLVPKDIGRNKPDIRWLYPNQAALQQQSDILDGLEASLKLVLDAAKPEEEEVEEPQLFQAKLDLNEDPARKGEVEKLFLATSQKMHYSSNYKVNRIFDVDIAAMSKAFAEYGEPIGNIMTLWHGTKLGNLLSILKGGFVIPPSNASYCTGRMFGNGVYFSDQSTKSLNYAGGWAPGQSGMGNVERIFMFLNKVAMGKPYYPTGYGDRSMPKPGYDSCFAEAGKSGVYNNEMIVYDCRQINPIMLVEFTR